MGQVMLWEVLPLCAGSHVILVPSPSWQESLTYFNRDPTRFYLAGGHLRPARSEEGIFFGSFHKVLESPGRTTAHAFLPETLGAPSFWDRPQLLGQTPLGSAGHRLSCHHGTPRMQGLSSVLDAPPNLGQEHPALAPGPAAPGRAWGVIVQNETEAVRGFRRCGVVRIRRQPQE